MKFEEIFKEEGLYKADTFAKGVAFEIKENSITGCRELFVNSFKHENDITPVITTITVYDNLFREEYTKVYTRQSLFV